MKSARQTFSDVIARAYVDACVAMTKANAGAPNALYREAAAIHDNTSYNDLPDHIKQAIQTSTTALLLQLNREGYIVTPKESVSGILTVDGNTVFSTPDGIEAVRTLQRRANRR